MNLDKVRDHLSYNPATGVVTWRKPTSNRVRVGQRCGAGHAKGYRQIRFMGETVLEHRLIWFYHYGEWPCGQIDHINGDRSDNRLANLRDIDGADNQKNMKLNTRSTSGVVGVHYDPATGKWSCRGHKNRYLGQFHCIATAGYVARRDRMMNGYHTNHGRR